MSIEYSVVVPTHNRIEILPEVIAALDTQQGAPPFELIIVDDGSDAATEIYLQKLRTSVPSRVLSQSKKGPAAARNAGVAAAQGRYLAFLGDDTVPGADWLALHDRRRREFPDTERVAVLGYTAWHRRMKVTPLLDYLNHHGLQFGYALIKDPDSLPFTFLYTSNLSVPRWVAVKEPFNEAFPFPAYEDIAAGYCWMTRHGIRLVYEPAARVEHYHPTDFDGFAARQEKAGYCAAVFHKFYPDAVGVVDMPASGPRPLPFYPKQWLRETIVRSLQQTSIRLPKLWRKTLRYYYLRGLRRGWREIVVPQKASISAD